MASSSVVYDRSAAILAAIVEHFALEAIAIELPARQFVANGPIAFDCEQVVVEPVRMYHGTTGIEGIPDRCVQLNAVEVRCWLLRCVPHTTEKKPIPAEEALDASAALILADLFELTQALAILGKGGTMDLVVTGAAPIQPQGQIGGSVATVRLTL